jgi:hypothetical protein
MKTKLIGLCGYAGAGKSTVARFLVREYGFWRQPFAGPLKGMLQSIGLTEDHTDGALKEKPCDLLGGVTPRKAMQLLGTEWGRAISPDIWVNIWEHRTLSMLEDDQPVVADDVRFANEAEAIRRLGGKVVRVSRPGIERPNGHASEALDFDFDVELVNGGTESDLTGVVQELFKLGAPKDRGSCITLDLGDQGTGYVVGLLTSNNEPTVDIKRVRKASLYMISGPLTGMQVTVPCSPDMLTAPTYH